MLLSQVVAAADNNAIGKNNKLLWTLPNDMKFFKNTTWGMPVIMGRKTFESLKNQPLTGRTNIIITSHKDLQPASGKITLADSTHASVQLAAQTDCKEAFVIGGGEIFKSFLPQANKIYLTRVHADIEGDVFFPALPQSEWTMEWSYDYPADGKHAYPYSFQLWIRKGQPAI